VSEIRLLDHGYIRLDDHMGSDKKVAAKARVSHAQDDQAGIDSERDAKLIRYLLRNRHTSPFEHVVFTFEVQAPIFILRQWHRHRTQSYSEVSARYTEVDEHFFVPDPATIGSQSRSNKQARDISHDNQNAKEAAKLIEWGNQSSYMKYKEMLNLGIPREVARVVLPQSMYSRMYTTVDLHNLFHFIGLRDHPHAQYEIRVYAQAMLDLIRPIVPICVQVFEEMRNANPNAICDSS
jgi:thymidylate synthase (FAD)